jgi:hypothetical protein
MSTEGHGERKHATGRITVRSYEPTPYDQPAEGPALVRIHVEEDLSGDIEAAGVVDFLQAQLSDEAASFVGIERVSGSLGGRSGSFLLQDHGTLAGNRESASGSSCRALEPASSQGFVGRAAFRQSSGKQRTSPLMTGSSEP